MKSQSVRIYQLVDDLARTVCTDDWTAAHTIAEYLSVDVTVAV